MPTVQTVLGQIEADQLGITYSHEHLLIRPEPSNTNSESGLGLESVETAVKELGFFKTAGGHALVEMTTSDTGRSPEGLKTITEQSGVHVIAATGYNKSKFSEATVAKKSVTELTDEIIRDLQQGMGDTSIRAGVIKIATSRNTITTGESKILEAAAEAHKQTGAPISTHTEAGTFALEQIKALTALGVAPEHLCIGHLDRKLEWNYHKAVADTGVFIVLDQFSKENYYSDSQRIQFVKGLMDSGHGKQLLIGSDLSRATYWPSHGFGNGPGLTFILWRIVPWMLEVGIPHEAVNDLLIHNPARAFSWRE
jgi:5-phospho-D-xylono-1,4-lactonase